MPRKMDHFDQIAAGLQLHESYQYNKALPFFKRALQQCPKCPAAIYNYANTLHMLGRDKEAKSLLNILINTDVDMLRKGCPDSMESPESFKLDAYFLLFHVELAITGSNKKALPFAEEHLRRRRRGLRSVWSKRQVLSEIRNLNQI